MSRGMRPGVLASPRNRRILWMFRILVGGCLFFIPATGAAVTWWFLDRTE